MRNLCLFLHAKYLVPSLTTQLIVDEINGLSDICYQYTNDKIREKLRANSNMSYAEIDLLVLSIQETDLYAACSSLLSTKYTRRV